MKKVGRLLQADKEPCLQLGELLSTARRVYDASETRLLITHASPGREGILAQLALAVRADLTVSAGLHFRHASSYNEFSVQEDADGFRTKLLKGKESFDRVWENVKARVEAVIDDCKRTLLENAPTITERVPPPAPTGPNPTGAISSEEPAWKTTGTGICSSAPVPSTTNKGKLGTDGEGTPAPATKSATPAPGGGTKPTTPAGTKPGTPVNGVGAKRAGKRGSVYSNQPPTTAGASPAVGESALPENGEFAGEQKSLDVVKSQDGRSTGAQTPPTIGPRRHPWTLYVRPLPIPVSEDELREFFKDAVEGITSIKIPIDFKQPQQPQRGFVYVEFTDEDAMRVGLEKHGDAIQNTKPNVEISNPTEHTSSFRGRGGPGRGGFGGRRGRGGGGPGAGADKWGSNAGRSVMQAAAAAAGPGRSVPGRGPKQGGQGGGQGGKKE
ncbi:hypothetical protein FRC07_008245 [Ceratobasidium sp. 392]|nr:hypothetical protein FRC07_008245 [Ceratobasidium sp. 392]